MKSKFKWSKWLGLACAITVLCYSALGVSQSSQSSVQLTTEPPIAQVSPLEAEATEYLGSGKYESPVRLKFQAKDATGAALQNAQFHLQVLTPPPTPWFTTDFPIVEGTKLLEIEGNAPTGEFQVEQVFPIRGNYQLKVDVTPVVSDAFAPIAQTLSLTVPENPLKYRYFPFVLAVLLGIGFVGGWIIGGRQEMSPGEVAPRKVRLLLSGVTVLAIGVLLFFNVSAEFGEAHAGMVADVPGASPNEAVIQSQGLRLELTGDKQTAVGQTATFRAKLIDSATNQPVDDAVFEIKSVQLENNWVAFAHQGVPDRQGELTWQEQFFDGAPHQVEVKVSPGQGRSFRPFQASREIEVEGIAPPMSVRLVGLLYFTGVLTLGLLAGLWIQRRRLQTA
jgi:hypothetical protein